MWGGARPPKPQEERKPCAPRQRLLLRPAGLPFGFRGRWWHRVRGCAPHSKKSTERRWTLLGSTCGLAIPVVLSQSPRGWPPGHLQGQGNRVSAPAASLKSRCEKFRTARGTGRSELGRSFCPRGVGERSPTLGSSGWAGHQPPAPAGPGHLPPHPERPLIPAGSLRLQQLGHSDPRWPAPPASDCHRGTAQTQSSQGTGALGGGDLPLSVSLSLSSCRSVATTPPAPTCRSSSGRRPEPL